METAPPARRIVFAVLLAAAVAGASIALPDAGSAETAEAEHATGHGPTLVAGSICEAHELRALAAERGTQIEIPPQYDKPYPSRSACRSHELAWDDSAPGPRQPIPFSHKHHAGEYEIACQYCHGGVERSPAAGVPSVELCMGCHAQFAPDYDQEFEGIRILKEHWGQSYVQENGTWRVQPRDESKARPIEWIQIHRVPEHVQFRHNRHVRAGVECNTCHGNLRQEDPVKVENLEKLYLVPDTRWWKYGIPTQKLEMGWCIQCHRENEASQDCLTCHH